MAHGMDHPQGSPYMKASPAGRFGPGKVPGDGSTETLPKLAAARTAGHSAAK